MTTHRKRNLTADDQAVEALLAEPERAYRIAHGLSAPELLRARMVLPADFYARAVAGAPGALTIRECLAELARAKLAEPIVRATTGRMRGTIAFGPSTQIIR